MKSYACPLGILLLCLSLFALDAKADFPDLELQTVSEDSLVAPVEIAHAGDGSGRLFIADQRGKIQIIDTNTDTLLATPFLDLLAKLVPQRANFDERGLLGVAFHPDYATPSAAGEGKFYVYYSAPSPNAPGTAADPVDHQSVIAEYTVSAGDANVANIASERILLTFDQPQFNHDGGDLAFGPDDLLYISTGDGGSSADNNAGHTGGSSAKPSGVLGNAQDLTNLLGKILRIDPQGNNGPGGEFGIPSTNPFVGQGGGVREEIYAYGLRNPWRISFDNGPGGTGRLFVADVGQGDVEEIDIVNSGDNFGWRNKEGSFDFDATAPGTGPFVDPIAQYAHPGNVIGNPPLPQIGNSVTGGEVYRGGTIPTLYGKYVFADWSSSFGTPSGTMLGLEETSPGVFELSQLTITGGNPIPRYITAIGSGENGDLYVATRTVLAPEVESPSGDATGVIFRIVAASESGTVNDTATVTPKKDNSMYSENGNSNGAGEFLFTGHIAQGGERRALMKFAMPTLPTGATVVDASVKLTLVKAAPGGSAGPFNFHRMSADWGEGGSDAGSPGGTGATPTAGDATWTRSFHNTVSWGTAGGDFVAAASASASVTGTVTTWTSATLTQDVQDWLDGDPNFGWILKDADTATSAKKFSSKEHGTAGDRPALVINYSATVTGTPVPAPAFLDLTAGSDSGVSDADNLTNDDTPTIEGIAPLGSTVTIFSNGSQVASQVVSTIPFSITTSVLANGANVITATTTEAGGGGRVSAESPPLNLTIDDMAPLAPTGLDLLSGSDNGSSNSDDMTSIDTPDIGGFAEVGSAVVLTSDLDGDVGSAAGAAPFTITTSPLQLGIHQLTAVATDAAGNSSPPSSALAVTIIEPVIDPREGKPVAVPGDEADVPPAIFISWEDVAAGIYDGLLLDQADGQSLVGAISNLKVAKPKTGSGPGGAVSGTINFGGRKARFKGTFDTNGVLAVTLPQSDGTTVDVQLQLVRTVSGGGEAIRGTIEWDGVIALADLARAPFHSRLNPAPPALVGRYTMLLPSAEGTGTTEPGGDGFATVTLATSGVVRVSGVLGDAKRFTESSRLSADDQFALYADLYGRSPIGGQIGGTMTLRNVANVSDFDGPMQWRKMPREKEKRYPLGFDVDLTAVGSKFVAPAPGARVLAQLADEHHNAELSFIGPTAPSPTGGDALDRVLSWATNNRLTHFGPERLRAVASARTGAMSGSFFDPVNKVRVSFKAVAFQKQGIAGGNFVSGDSSGAIRVLPGTTFVYPGSEATGALTRADLPGAPATPPLINDLLVFDPAAAGTFYGVLDDGGTTTGGLEKVRVSSSGAISGQVWVSGKRFAFRGSIDLLTGGAVIVVPRKNLDPVTLTLQLGLADTTVDGFQLTGTVDADSVVHDVDAQRLPVFTSAIPSPHLGRYTLVMRAPDSADPALEPGGDGYGTLTVSFRGTARAVFRLADGTRVSVAGRFSRNDEWSIHRNLYRGIIGGFLAGKLTARSSAAISDIDGELRWVKPNGARPTTVYPAGFDLLRGVIGSAYTKPLKGERAFDILDDDFYNAWLRIVGGIGFADIDRAITWDSRNRLTYFGPERVRLRFSTTTGIVTGSYIDTPNDIRIIIGGAFVDDQDLVTGFYLFDGKSENATIEPRTAAP